MFKKMTRMKAERLRRGLSQQTLAVAAEVAIADVSRLETGRLVAYPKQAERIAHVLGIEPKELQLPVQLEVVPVSLY